MNTIWNTICQTKIFFLLQKIYDANGNLNKRWYVYFSYLNPKTGKLERMKNIYGKTNRYKTKEARYSILSVYKKRLKRLLEEVYNLFLDDTAHHERMLSKNNEDMSTQMHQEYIRIRSQKSVIIYE